MIFGGWAFSDPVAAGTAELEDFCSFGACCELSEGCWSRPVWTGSGSSFWLRCAKGKLKIGRTHLWASCLLTARGTASVSPLSTLSKCLSPPSLLLYSPTFSAPESALVSCLGHERPETGHHFPWLWSIRHCGQAGCWKCLHLASLWVFLTITHLESAGEKGLLIIERE